MLPTPVSGLEQPAFGPLLDRYGRRHTYVRVSVTDRCNFRCTYCMPAAGLDWLPKTHLLSFEEITRIVRVLANCGVERVRLTGGEPTVRHGLVDLVGQLAAIPGIRDLSMTTNGHLFAAQAQAFKNAGLNRINISLDSLAPAQFRAMTRGGDLSRVLQAIEAALAAGLRPVKINAVIIGGENESQVEAMIEHFAPYGSAVMLRFIEYMPFTGNHPTWNHVPVAQLRKKVAVRWGLDPYEGPVGGGPAVYGKVHGTELVVGFISPITEHFCHDCNRLRLQADGHLRTCLSREALPSLRDLLREGVTDAQLEEELRGRLWAKVPGHEADGLVKAFEGTMTSIGG